MTKTKSRKKFEGEIRSDTYPLPPGISPPPVTPPLQPEPTSYTMLVAEAEQLEKVREHVVSLITGLQRGESDLLQLRGLPAIWLHLLSSARQPLFQMLELIDNSTIQHVDDPAVKK